MILANRLRLENLTDKTPSDIAAFNVEELALLIEELDEEKSRLKELDDNLSLALDLKYAGIAQGARQREGKDTGTARFADGAFTVVANLPKRVKWDQTRLSLAVHTIVHDWREDASEYVQTEYKISEAAYNAWPKAVRNLFTSARSVETGKSSYRFERKDGRNN